MSITPNLYAKARAEIIALFAWSADSLTPDQTLRIDCAVALRLALDDLQGRIVRGESADVARMLTASEALSRLLPPSALANPPAEEHGDPRLVMWEIYKTMRERGELSLRALAPQDEVATLKAENERLKARLAGKEHSDVPTLVESVPAPANVVPLPRPNPPAASAAPQSSAPPQYDYSRERGWRDHVLPTGEITSVPISSKLS